MTKLNLELLLGANPQSILDGMLKVNWDKDKQNMKNIIEINPKKILSNIEKMNKIVELK